ncbi:prepilin-type N-terminal cleavage/methylation domain-containing protein [Psychrobium sp. 1_MG-2023]|uniref:pilin n=1 Tax=Psychrobium sp. 1_MG-2023 TaxID=3062624 RepID=UPI000C340CEE|nr:type II secretion system protein [Psychrobium sp. 1_MG-2023]MDP2559688.1 type II secretion system protein [Psychrobium sp. 1_MG-2023]PKF59519.1 hypothetical protein CW748_01735 [Alteromonadales bacterium alter-6D02]
MKLKQSGFTLIELVIVISVIAILSVVAVPKFLNVSDKANEAVLASVSGSLNSTNTLIQSMAVIEGQEEGLETLKLDDGEVAIEDGLIRISSDFDKSLIASMNLAFETLSSRDAVAESDFGLYFLPTLNLAYITNPGYSVDDNCYLLYQTIKTPGKQVSVNYEIEDSGC